VPGAPIWQGGKPAPSSAGGIDWNPISWATAAWNDAGSIVAPLKKWVIKQIVSAIGFVENDISKAKSFLSSAIQGVGSGFEEVYNQITLLWKDVGSGVDAAIHTVLKEMASLVKDAVNPVIHEIDALSRAAEKLFEAAEHAGEAAINWFYDHTIRPALHDLEAAIHDVEAGADKALHEFDLHVVKPLEHDASEALHDAKKAIYFIDHSALDAIHLIDETWDWLEAFSHHPFKSLEALPGEELAKLTSSGLAGSAQTITSGWTGLIAELDKKFPDAGPS